MSEASGTYFIDTNIWLYAFFQTESGTNKQKIARSSVSFKRESTAECDSICVLCVITKYLDQHLAIA